MLIVTVRNRRKRSNLSSTNVTITISGYQFQDLNIELDSEVAQKLVERLAQSATLTMFAQAPHRTGLLANTIRKSIGHLSAEVGPTVPYAPFVEYGTKPHLIMASPGGVLAFNVGGDMVFTSLVHHPGTRPNRFVQRTVKTTLDEVPEVFRDVWNDYTQRNQGTEVLTR